MTETARLAAVAEVLDAQVEAGRLPGYVAAVRHRGVTEVLTGGRLAVGSAAAMAPDSLFRIASVTKLVAGALTLSLVADGVLGLDDPVARWLPELARPRVTARRGGPLEVTVPAERPITVRHLLTNTAGLGWDGGTGTSAWVDPQRDVVAVLLTQRMMTGPLDGPDEFWTAVDGCL